MTSCLLLVQITNSRTEERKDITLREEIFAVRNFCGINFADEGTKIG